MELLVVPHFVRDGQVPLTEGMVELFLLIFPLLLENCYSYMLGAKVPIVLVVIMAVEHHVTI